MLPPNTGWPNSWHHVLVPAASSVVRVVSGCRAAMLLFSTCAAAHAQELKVPDTPELLHIAPAPSDRFPAKWYPRQGDGTDVAPAPVLDRPYTAVVDTVSPQKTEKGETFPFVQRGFQARDRLGRTRVEAINGGMVIDDQEVKTKIVIVSDPVSHCQFHWTLLTTGGEMPPEDRVAFVACGPQTLRYKDLDLYGTMMERADGADVDRDHATRIEHLPPVHMDGLTVERMRVTNTQTDEHGKANTWSSETWYSPDLKDLIRSGTDADYEGLSKINRIDPDAKMFYPPDGYRIEFQRPR